MSQQTLSKGARPSQFKLTSKKTNLRHYNPFLIITRSVIIDIGKGQSFRKIKETDLHKVGVNIQTAGYTGLRTIHGIGTD